MLAALSPPGLLPPRVSAPEPSALLVLSSWVLLFRLWGHAALVPPHLPPHWLHHGLADEGLRGRPDGGPRPRRHQVTCEVTVTAGGLIAPFMSSVFSHRMSCFPLRRALGALGSLSFVQLGPQRDMACLIRVQWRLGAVCAWHTESYGSSLVTGGISFCK